MKAKLAMNAGAIFLSMLAGASTATAGQEAGRRAMPGGNVLEEVFRSEGEQTRPTGPVTLVRGPIVEATAKLETVFDKAFWAEGPAEGPDGKIYFSDITITFATGMYGGNIWAFDPATSTASIYRSPSNMSNGIEFDGSTMIVAEGADFGGRRMTSTDMTTGRSKIIAGGYNGRPFNAPNDIAVDAQGRIYFTDPRYAGHEAIEQPVFGVYRIELDGSVKLVLADMYMPNGIAISPDQKTLYVTEIQHFALDPRIDKDAVQAQGLARINAYDLNNGKPHNRRVFVDYGKNRGADGITLDRDGNLYAAVQNPGRSGIIVYAPDGKEIAFVPTPIPPANVTLTTHSKTNYMYITAQKDLYRIKVRIPGHRPR